MPYLRTAHARPRSTPGLADRYRALRVAHARLEEKVTAEMERPLPDTTAIQRLKRRKLLVKDEMAAIERLLAVLGKTVDELLVPAETARRLAPRRSAAAGARRPVSPPPAA